jgi:hypothetical protein
MGVFAHEFGTTSACRTTTTPLRLENSTGFWSLIELGLLGLDARGIPFNVAPFADAPWEPYAKLGNPRLARPSKTVDGPATRATFKPQAPPSTTRGTD